MSDAPQTGSSTRRADAPAADVALTPEEEALLGEDVEIDVDLRRSVLVMHRGVETLDHYRILGVARSADRKALKRAYFDLAARYHPDKYFRKKLGSFKPRMEVIFTRITLAHDTLTNRERREEYDTYLDEQQRSRSIEDLMADALAEVQRAQATIEATVNEAPVAAPPTAQNVSVSSPSASGMRPIDPAIRREALARRLLGGRPAPPPRSTTPMPSPAPAPLPPAEAVDALKRRYEERKLMAQTLQARKYVANGEAALAAGDLVGAANNFRIAHSLTPSDGELGQRAREAQQRADALLAETYAKQGAYEGKHGQWAEASRSWSRVCKARPGDHAAHEKAAESIRKANGDLHEASRLATRACELEPQKPSYRVTLANVYLAAGLTLNARRELETAAQLAPQDDTIRAMLKGVDKTA